MPRRKHEDIEFNGEKKSRKQWCLKTGVDPDLAYRRIHYLGWPPTQAVGLEPRVVEDYGRKTRIGNKKSVRVTIDGVTRTLRGWHYATGIQYETLVYRYNHWPRGADILEPEPQTPTVRMRQKTGKGADLASPPSRGKLPVWTPKDIADPDV
jgi:hypothetical protein